MFVTTVTPDYNGNIWFIANFSSKVVKFDGKNSWTIFDSTNGLMSSVINSITPGLGNKIWFGTNRGAFCFDGKEWINYTEKDGLVFNTIDNIVIDKNNTKWFLTFKGISKFDDKKWVSYDTSDGLPEYITGIDVDSDGVLWMYPSATTKGVTKFDGKKVENIIEENNLIGNTIYDASIDSKGNKWFVTYDYLSRLKKDTWTHYKTPKEYTLTNFAIDKEDVKWGVFSNYKTGYRLGKFIDKKWKYISITDKKITSIHTMSIDYQKNIWLSNSAKGLFKYNGSSWKIYNSENGLPDNQIYSIASGKKGIVWVGTANGVGKFDGKKWNTLTTKDGLLSNVIARVYVDKNNNPWFVCAGKGIAHLKKNKWTYFEDEDIFTDFTVFDLLVDKNDVLWICGDKVHNTQDRYGVCNFKDGKWRTISFEDGLVDNTITSIIEDNNGDIWALSNSGLSIIKNSSVDIKKHFQKKSETFFPIVARYKKHKQKLLIHYQLPKYRKAYLSIISLNGKRIIKKDIQTNASGEGIVEIIIPYISTGVYICQLKVFDLGEISSKIIISK